jgi:predicted Zn-dependent protease
MSEHARLSRRHFLLVAGAGLLCGCATAPITGRRQIILVSAEEKNATGAEIYRQMLAKKPVTTDPRIVAPAERITGRLQAVTDPPVPPVEVGVIDDAETVNAFALPVTSSSCARRSSARC